MRSSILRTKKCGRRGPPSAWKRRLLTDWLRAGGCAYCLRGVRRIGRPRRRGQSDITRNIGPTVFEAAYFSIASSSFVVTKPPATETSGGNAGAPETPRMRPRRPSRRVRRTWHRPGAAGASVEEAAAPRWEIHREIWYGDPPHDDGDSGQLFARAY